MTGALQRLTAAGRLVAGEFRPVEAGGTGEPEWCDAQTLRRLRRRSLAALRQEVEAVPPRALAAFLPQWQHLSGHQLRGEDGLFRVVEQLQGAAVPASALERLILPGRLSDYQPALLDKLMADGEIGWSGAGALPGKDGWISLHLAENADLLRPEPLPLTLTPQHEALLQALSSGYGVLFEQLRGQLPDEPPAELVTALWDLVWAGRITNDTLGPVRALLGSARTAGATAHRAPRGVPRGRYGALGRTPARPADPTVGGRWSLLPEPAEPTARAAAQAQVLLDRHGVLTRGTAQAERVQGGFAAVYRVLSAFEERGRARRGYLVEGSAAPSSRWTARWTGCARSAAGWSGPPPTGPVPPARRRPSLPSRRPSCWPRRTRPTPTGPRCPGPNHRASRPPRTARAARPGRWWCWSTVISRSTWSAAANRCSAGPRTRRS